jgi:hypothetical protein
VPSANPATPKRAPFEKSNRRPRIVWGCAPGQPARAPSRLDLAAKYKSLGLPVPFQHIIDAAGMGFGAAGGGVA